MADTGTIERLDREFDAALLHSSRCRIAYDNAPRCADGVGTLGAARARLEDARRAIEMELHRLDLLPDMEPAL